jgi:hypothetical protein
MVFQLIPDMYWYVNDEGFSTVQGFVQATGMFVVFVGNMKS